MNTFTIDQTGKLLHIIEHEVRAIIEPAHIATYVKGGSFETQLAYQRVQEDLEKQQAEAAAKAEAELRKQTAGIEALVAKLVAEKLAGMSTASKGAGDALNLGA